MSNSAPPFDERMGADEYVIFNQNIASLNFRRQTNAFLVRVCAINGDKRPNITVVADLDPRALRIDFREAAYIDFLSNFRLTDYPNQGMETIWGKRGQPSKPLLKNYVIWPVSHFRISPSDSRSPRLMSRVASNPSAL